MQHALSWNSYVLYFSVQVKYKMNTLRNAYSILSLRHHYSPEEDLQTYSTSQFEIHRIKESENQSLILIFMDTETDCYEVQ